MKNYKLIILGPQCSGKTTLARYLREHSPNLPILEEDELFTELSGGEYPQDVAYKEKTLRPKLEDKIRQSDNLIFLTSYCNPVLLIELKSKGFKVIQLVLDKEEFNRRNEKRMREDGYADANIWAKEVFDFHVEVRNQGLVDKIIDTDRLVEDVAKEFLDFIETVNFQPVEKFKELADKVFEEQKQRIFEKLPFAELHHVGGTSIPNSITKGDLDINVRVEKENFNTAVEILKGMYKINQPHNWNENFASFKDDRLEIDFGVQLTIIDSPDDIFITQREILLKNPELVKELNDLKLKYEGKSMDEYRKVKSQFFEKITQ